MPLYQHTYKKEAEPELVCKFDAQNRLTEFTVSPLQRIWSVVDRGINFVWRIDHGTKNEYFQYFRINGVNSTDMTLLSQLRARFVKGAMQSSTPHTGYSENIYSVCENMIVEDTGYTELCAFNDTNAAQYQIYSTNPIKDNLYFTDTDGTRYWMSITHATGHRSLVINGVQTSDEALKDQFLARVSKGPFVKNVSGGSEGTHAYHYMCAKYLNS